MNTREEIDKMLDTYKYKLLLDRQTGELFEATPENTMKRIDNSGRFSLVQDMTTTDWLLLVQNLIMKAS